MAVAAALLVWGQQRSGCRSCSDARGEAWAGCGAEELPTLNQDDWTLRTRAQSDFMGLLKDYDRAFCFAGAALPSF